MNYISSLIQEYELADYANHLHMELNASSELPSEALAEVIITNDKDITPEVRFVIGYVQHNSIGGFLEVIGINGEQIASYASPILKTIGIAEKPPYVFGGLVAVIYALLVRIPTKVFIGQGKTFHIGGFNNIVTYVEVEEAAKKLVSSYTC